MSPFLLGAIAAAFLVAALFFLRFWRDTRDRLFLFFAAAFGLEALSRAILAIPEQASESLPLPYLVRLGAYLLLLSGIVAKNRER